MKNMSEVVGISVLVLSCLAVSQVSEVIAREQSEHYTWSISRGQSADKVRFTIDHRAPGRRTTWSSDMPWNHFRGLDSQDLSELNGAHTFKFVRDAGSFVCAGQFSRGYGKGSYTFEKNPSYDMELQKLGYTSPATEDLLSMFMSDVTLEFARGVKSVVADAATHDLLELRNHGLSVEYIREALTLGKLSIHDLTQMKNNNVQPEFLRRLKAAGYDIPAQEIIALRNHGVDSNYIRQLAEYGLKPAAQDLIDMKNQGVSPAFLKEAKAMGHVFSTQDIIQMRNHGVDSAYLRKLKDTGFNDLDAEKIIKLRTHGID